MTDALVTVLEGMIFYEEKAEGRGLLFQIRVQIFTFNGLSNLFY